MRRLINAKNDEGITTDELSGVTGLNSEGVRKAMAKLARLGLVSKDAILTAYVHHGVQRSLDERFRRARDMEKDLISLCRSRPQTLRQRSRSLFTSGRPPSV